MARKAHMVVCSLKNGRAEYPYTLSAAQKHDDESTMSWDARCKVRDSEATAVALC